MPKYSALVSVDVHRRYSVILVVDEADNEADAISKLRHLAQGMEAQEFDALVEEDASINYADGPYVEVTFVGQVEEEPEDEEANEAANEAGKDQGWAEWGAQDPEAATRIATELAEEE